MRKGKKQNIQEIRGGLEGRGVGEGRRGNRQVGGHGGGGREGPTVNTIDTDGKRSFPGSVGEQRRVTPEHPSNPEGALEAPSRSRSGGVGLTPPVRPEMLPGHTALDRAKATGVPRVQGGRGAEQPRPRRAGETRCRASSLVLSGIPARNSASTRNTLLKRIGSFTDSHPLSLFNYRNNLRLDPGHTSSMPSALKRAKGGNFTTQKGVLASANAC